MKIFQVSLKCLNLNDMKTFYTQVLEMGLQNEADDYFSVMAGTTKLLFEKDETLPNYHLCFRTNSNFFEYMFQKLAAKKFILPDENGNSRLFWQGKQAYFSDPDGNILECLKGRFNGEKKMNRRDGLMLAR